MSVMISVPEAARQDLLACGKADGLIPGPTTDRQHGLPSVMLSRLDACKDEKVIQWCGTQVSSHYTESH